MCLCDNEWFTDGSVICCYQGRQVNYTQFREFMTDLVLKYILSDGVDIWILCGFQRLTSKPPPILVIYSDTSLVGA